MKAKLSFLAALCCTLFSFAQPAPEVQDACIGLFPAISAWLERCRAASYSGRSALSDWTLIDLLFTIEEYKFASFLTTIFKT